MLHLVTLAVTALLAAGSPNIPRPIEPLTLSDAEATDLLEAPDRRLRVESSFLQWHVAEGLRRSPTFAALMRALEDTDVIVHLVEAARLPPQTDAQTVLANGKGEFRFVRVHVGAKRRGDSLIALIGHELMHVLEIAGAPDVRDEKALEALYEQIGMRGPRPRQYDTQEALVIERRVHRELGGPSRTTAHRGAPVTASR